MCQQNYELCGSVRDVMVLCRSGWDEYGYEYGMPSHNITIRNCQLSTPCAAFAIGSEMSGGVFDVTVSLYD